jgi:hypothetical protein
MEPEDSFQCWQESATGLILSQMNPVHILKPYLFKMY